MANAASQISLYLPVYLPCILWGSKERGPDSLSASSYALIQKYQMNTSLCISGVVYWSRAWVWHLQTKIQVLISQIYDLKPFIFMKCQFPHLTKRSAWHEYTAIFQIDNQQGPTIQHRELCSILCNSLDGENLRTNGYTYMYNWITLLYI